MVGITNKIMLAEMRRQQKLSQDIVDGQTAISSGITLNKPSDDPLAWVQVSDIGRAQAQQAAWAANVSYGTTRAGNAEANLSEIDSLLTRAQELATSARNGSLNDTSRAAIVEELSTIKTTIGELIDQKDYQGVSVFDDQQSVLVPLSRGLNLAVVGTKQEVSEGIDVNGTAMSINDILDQTIAAVQSRDDSAIAASVEAVQSAQSHIAVEQAKQGVRGDRLETIGNRLTDVSTDLTERRGDLESTNLQDVISRLQANLLQLDAAQSAFARINQQTLFDLIK
ncbi:flagellin [Sphingobium sp.]|uniref:flagellin n=1 Tax=Sphingobium sp. TaxID=1912891 RepID=UPI00262B204F|nr:flagellin [Sphingobium sp.]